MSFWDLSDGETAVTKDKEYEIAGGGNMEPIPDGSTVLAMIDEAKWDTRGDAEFISLRWAVLAPEAYKNRKVYHKLWVTDDDPNAKGADKAAKKRDKARRMLAAIDANAGGKLTARSGKPDDEALTLHLTNRPMVIKCMVWSMTGDDGTEMAGNWIAAVAPKDREIAISDAPAPAPRASQKASPAAATYASEIDDEIPF